MAAGHAAESDDIFGFHGFNSAARRVVMPCIQGKTKILNRLEKRYSELILFRAYAEVIVYQIAVGLVVR